MVFFPLDEKLQLTAHGWSRQTIANALRLGVEIASYERAAESFSALTHITLSKSSLHRLVKEYGKVVEQQEAEAARAVVEVPKGEEVVWRDRIQPDSETMAVSADGVMIHLIDEGWKEVKMMSVSAVTQDETTSGEGEGRLTKHSYRAGLWDASTFATHYWAEACRRGLDHAKTVVCVSDGAAWIWAIAFMCFAARIEILDWWHAVQRLWTIASATFSAEEQATHWVEVQKGHLISSRLCHLFHAIRHLYPRGVVLPDAVRHALGYLFHNRRRIDYATFRQAGYPIASGTIESACKTMVQARLKQSGMRWSRTGAQAMLSLRCLGTRKELSLPNSGRRDVNEPLF